MDIRNNPYCYSGRVPILLEVNCKTCQGSTTNIIVIQTTHMHKHNTKHSKLVRLKIIRLTQLLSVKTIIAE